MSVDLNITGDFTLSQQSASGHSFNSVNQITSSVDYSAFGKYIDKYSVNQAVPENEDFNIHVSLFEFLDMISFSIDDVDVDNDFIFPNFVRMFVELNIDNDFSKIGYRGLMISYVNFIPGLTMTESYEWNCSSEGYAFWQKIAKECKKFLNHENLDEEFMIETFGHRYINYLMDAFPNEDFLDEELFIEEELMLDELEGII